MGVWFDSCYSVTVVNFSDEGRTFDVTAVVNLGENRSHTSHGVQYALSRALGYGPTR